MINLCVNKGKVYLKVVENNNYVWYNLFVDLMHIYLF